MIQIIVKFNNKTKLIEIDKNEKINTIYKKIGINDFLTKDLFISFNNKVILDIETFKDINIKNNEIIFVNYKLKGGIIDAIIDLLEGMVKLLSMLGGLIETLIKLFVNIMELIPNIFEPSKLIDDVLYGVTHGITGMFGAIVEKIDIGGGDVDKEKDGGPFGVTEKKQAICVPPNLMNLLIMVLCPPLALFLNKGFSGGWFITIICALMTYFMYYFPGFIFAALHILC